MQAKPEPEFLSVWPGTDAALLDKMLTFYPNWPPLFILDCTYNAGRMWKGSRYAQTVVGMDINPAVKPHLVDDNRTMSSIRDEVCDVVVYDPPHVPNQGRDNKKDFVERFGLNVKAGKDEGWSLGHTHLPVLQQCKRVLKPKGLVLAKVCDYVHNHRYTWGLCDFIAAVKAAGMTPCDLIIKTRKGPIVDPKWKVRHHVRRCHVYWVVCRNGDCCERR
jgi:SAM-dependent methyltransferase